MFKTIPGNTKYVLSLSQELRDLEGYPVEVVKTKEGLTEGLDYNGWNLKTLKKE